LKISQVKEWTGECPYDFQWREALVTLYSLQHFEAMCERGTTYAPNTFYNSIFNVLSGLRNGASRKTILKHLDRPECIVCHEPMGLSGRVLDHIIPKHLGGEDNLENTMVLCRNHNSSKGKKDILEWWVSKEWKAADLPRNILCLYARIMWKNIDRIYDDPHDLPNYVRLFIAERASPLSEDHIVALYGSTYAAMGFLAWERMHDAR
jgi:hypothetical protein